jgi:glycosyltransferase involved in cell wall biosynthesis
MTPSVHAKRQVVYCHNPAPFYRHFRIRDFFYDPGFFVFYILYKAVYRNQVHRNYALIVQQTWLRDEFSRFTRHKKIVVSTPAFRGDAAPPAPPEISKCPGNPLVFFYPAVPRVFKNMECVCEAFSQLPSDLQSVIEIRLTTDGTENRYAKFIRRKYGHLPGVRFIGYQGRDGMKRQYADANLLLFPSRLETWGLPITEAKSLGIPLLVADLPYARETVGDCDSVKFISVDDSEAWRDAFIGFQRGTLSFDLSRAVVPAEPSASNWAECWKLISEGL